MVTSRTAYNREWKEKNREHLRAYRAARMADPERRRQKTEYGYERRRQRMARVDEIKLALGCVDCGYNAHPRALQFDHVRGTKISEVARLVANGNTWTTIEAEIQKCVVRCANCHSIKTWGRP